MAFIPKPPFPNVPKLPGVPQMKRSPLSVTSLGPVIGTAIALGRLWEALTSKPKWGIYKVQKTQKSADGLDEVIIQGNAKPVVEPDSVLDFGYHNEVSVPNYPVQDGAFASYNRVNLPYEATVRLFKGGSEGDRRKFLEQIDTIMDSTDLYYILTPERTYLNVNPVRFELTRRGAQGAYQLAEVDLFFQEIRTVQATYTSTSKTMQNAQDPSAQPVNNRGTVAGERPENPPTLAGVVQQ